MGTSHGHRNGAVHHPEDEDALGELYTRDARHPSEPGIGEEAARVKYCSIP